MANKTFQGRIIQKHDTKANWDKATNFVPLKGEIIVYDDLKKIKIGDGATKVGSLAFINDLDTLATVAKTGSYSDLKNKPTIPSVGNGTLTIQKNGTSAGTFTANATTNKTINITVPTKVSELTDDVVKGKYLPLTGGDMSGKLTAPKIETGSGDTNYFQSRKFRGEGDAATYYHAIDFGYKNHDRVDFHEYGGIWNFFKNTSGKAGEGSLCGKITTNGWEGNAKLTGSPTAPTPGTSDNSTRIATTAFVNSFNSTKLESNGDGSNVTAAFTAASTRANIATGEKLSVLFGKIAKWFADLGSLAFKSTVAKSDLASDVQTSLGKADSALQSVTKSDVGLGNVDNVKQYSATNPPPYPVTSVNGKTGAITVREVPAVTTTDNGKFLRVVNGAWTATTAPNKFTFTATAGQSTFTIPFDFEDSSALTVYYNGIMMKETDNYTVSGKVITLTGFTAEAGDYLTVMGIEGAVAIDYGKEAEKAIKQIQAVKTSAINEINTIKTDTINEINDVVAGLPQDLSSIMSTNKTNTMAANSKITMHNTYTPSANGDVATKKYVDDSKPSIVGTSTTYPIYIGSSTPASGTAPLLWIDTTSSTGVFKYRTSTTGTWTAVPVAYT